jgi:hypothetical protein
MASKAASNSPCRLRATTPNGLPHIAEFSVLGFCTYENFNLLDKIVWNVDYVNKLTCRCSQSRHFHPIHLPIEESANSIRKCCIIPIQRPATKNKKIFTWTKKQMLQKSQRAVADVNGQLSLK